jgi:predicted negative regulator of RcsB-dependent stress response
MKVYKHVLAVLAAAVLCGLSWWHAYENTEIREAQKIFKGLNKKIRPGHVCRVYHVSGRTK